MRYMYIVVSVLVFGFAQVQSQVCQCSCPNGWIANHDSCYLFGNTTGMNHSDAVLFCQGNHGYLVQIETADENTFLKNHVKQMTGTRYWIGLDDIHVENVWRWGSSGHVANFTDWIQTPLQPDNTGGNEDCAAFAERWGYRWNDWPCDQNFRPLCENHFCKVTEENCCPDGWIAWDKSCYLISQDVEVNYTEAENYCQGNGGHLVSLETTQENEFLKSQLAMLKKPYYPYLKGYYWMGMSDRAEEGIFRWQSGSPVTFSDWAATEPNSYHGTNEDCVVFDYRRGNKWNDDECTLHYKPLCELKKALPSSTIG